MEKKMEKIISFVKNHAIDTFIPALMISGLVFFGGMAKPTTKSPMTGEKVDAGQLKIEYEYLVNQYQYAADQLAEELEKQNKLLEFITSLAAGQVTNWPGVLNLFLTGGLAGALFSTVNKNKQIKDLKAKFESANTI